MEGESSPPCKFGEFGEF